MSKTQTVTIKKLSDLAEKIRQARLDAHLSQADLGEHIGVTDKSISAYEKGRSTPPFEKLQRIANSTHKPLVYFSGIPSDNITLADKLSSIERELAEVKRLLKEHRQ